MKLFFIQSTGIVLLLIFLFSECHRVPITGRKQFDFVPEGEVVSLAEQQYSEFLKEHQVITGTADAEMVQRVGRNIANAVEKFCAENGLQDRVKGYKWEFNLVKAPQVNAFALPGGKVVVYTGIIPVTHGDAGLATVLGHEIGHVVARHGSERMSQQLFTQLGGTALSVALADKPTLTRDLFLASYGMGTQVGILLPYSRKQESEADHLGLIFMAMAGYDPHQAIDFWERMNKMAQEANTPALLSDHPSNSTRIENLKKELPEAIKYYHPILSNKK